MKFSIAAIMTNVMLVSSLLAMHLSQDIVSLNSTDAASSITISNPSVGPPPSATIADAMSGSTAIASITVKGHEASSQSISGTESMFKSPSIAALAITIASALATL